MIVKRKKPGMRLQNKVDLGICKRFRDIRKNLGLTQPEYAEVLGTTRVAVNAIEHGRYNPGLELLKELRSQYHYSYDYIIDGK